MGNPQYDFKLDGKVPFLDYPLKLEIETDLQKKFELEIKADDDLDLEFEGTCDTNR